MRKISVEMERRREKEFMFGLMENGMESFLIFPFFCSVKSLSFLCSNFKMKSETVRESLCTQV